MTSFHWLCKQPNLHRMNHFKLISVVLHFSRSSRMSRLAGWWLQFDFYILHSAHSFLNALFNCFHMRIVWDWEFHYGLFFYSQNTRYVNRSLTSSHSNHVLSNIRYIRVYAHMFVDELSCNTEMFFTVWIAKQISWPGAQSCTHVECILDAKFRPLYVDEMRCMGSINIGYKESTTDSHAIPWFQLCSNSISVYLGFSIARHPIAVWFISWKIHLWIDNLVGGFKHLLFSTIYGMSSFPLTFILFKMVIAPPTRLLLYDIYYMILLLLLAYHWMIFHWKIHL